MEEVGEVNYVSRPAMSKTPVISSSTAPKTPGAFSGVQGYLDQVVHLSKVNPQEDWLPITESRTGNALYAAFHSLSSGLGFQALLLPLAFATLGWAWGIICLSVAFAWQLYTLWILIQLHEAVPGMRYSRYLQLSMVAFGEKRGKLLALFPTMYLSGATCVALIMIGGATMKLLFRLFCEAASSCNINLLTTIEWYIVFTCSAVVLAQLPNLNSIAGVSLLGALTAVTYCTLIWTVSVSKGRLATGASDNPPEPNSDVGRLCWVLNALGIIAFAFRGHNLVLEIQGTMPSSEKKPARVPMWKGVKFAYLVIAMCMYPMAIGGYWAYGNLIPSNGGMLSAMYKHHRHDTAKAILVAASVLVIVNCLTSFQIYAMPVFDNLEFKFTSKMQRPCPWWLRTGIRAFFGCLTFFISVALPFLPALAGLLGGISLPVTAAYPCFMWIVIKKPPRYGPSWWFNWVLGGVGMVLSVLLVFGAIWSIAALGIEIHFFKPK
ncbi:lysine histidine transporter-like 8 [Diospyros lotus]|uniref:lysine histidine transporter-like 8 n=1 Tax=Diospyros lotus TaxID=55363 RepID=UPI00225C2925|nr:lysine histidine transporter-like 8 [Diospyros lotus]